MARDPNVNNVIAAERARRSGKPLINPNASEAESANSLLNTAGLRNSIMVSGPDGRPMPVPGTPGAGNTMLVDYKDLGAAAQNVRNANPALAALVAKAAAPQAAQAAPAANGFWSSVMGSVRNAASGAAQAISDKYHEFDQYGKPLLPMSLGQAMRQGQGRNPNVSTIGDIPKKPTGQYGQSYGPAANLPQENWRTALSRAAGGEVFVPEEQQPVPKERGLTLQERQNVVSDVVANERQRNGFAGVDFNKMRGEVDPTDMVPDPNSTPLNQAEMDAIAKRIAAANAPVYKPPQMPDTFIKSEVPVDARAKAMALRQQIADEQAQMLRDRHHRGLTYTKMPQIFARDAALTDDSEKDPQTVAMQRIDALRQELNAYERAGQQDKFRIRTPQSNFEMQRDLAKQASDIMAKDVANMESQIAAMPEGPAKDAQAEKLRALKFQQQEQFRKANVMEPDAVGPVAPGVQPGDYQEAMKEAGAATERQQKAGPELMKFAGDLSAMNMARGQELEQGRLAQEQRAKDMQKARYEASMAELTAPERIRALGIKQGESAIGRTEAETRKIEAETGTIAGREAREDKKLDAAIKESQAKVDGEIARTEGINVENSLKKIEVENAKARQPIQAELDKINLEIAKTNAEAQKQFGGLTPEMQARKDALTQQGIQKAGVTEEKFARTMENFTKLKQFIGGWNGKTLTGTTWTNDPAGSKELARQIEDMAMSMKDASKFDKEFIRTKARELLAGAPEVADYGWTAGSLVTGAVTGGLMPAVRESNRPELKATFLRIQNAMNILKELAGSVDRGVVPEGR